jgi:hypothetical protein
MTLAELGKKNGRPFVGQFPFAEASAAGARRAKTGTYAPDHRARNYHHARERILRWQDDATFELHRYCLQALRTTAPAETSAICG